MPKDDNPTLDNKTAINEPNTDEEEMLQAEITMLEAEISGYNKRLREAPGIVNPADPSSDSRISALKAELQSARDKLAKVGEKQKTQRQLQTLAQRIDRLEQIEHFDTIVQSYTKAAQRLEKLSESQRALERIIAANDESIENFKAAVRESSRFQYATELWTGRANRALRSWQASIGILVVLLVLVPAIGVWFHQQIVAFFGAVGEAVVIDLPENANQTAVLLATFSRLVMITLPIVFYIWLIRIVVRFNTRSLLLMDDANQRNTMLETYLHLVEQDQTVNAERPLILEALFRRAPGHGPDSIEPPNLTDVVKLSTGQRRPE